jgi:preprotein translocase subunit SecB
MEDSKKINNQINLDSIVLIKSNFSRDLFIDAQDKTKVTQDVNIETSTSDLKSDKFAVYLNIDFVINYAGKKVVEINTTYAGSFDKTNTAVDDKALESFIDINAPAIIFPFVREEIAILTSKAGIGTVLLQPVNFVELSKKKKQKD